MGILFGSRSMKTMMRSKKIGKKIEKNALVCLCFLSVLFLNILYVTGAAALPKDYEVVAGAAEFKAQDNTLTINASDKAIINYKSFDVAQDEKVIVNLPNTASQILNRVNSPDPTMIYGAVVCNGMFILVNESGIYVAPTANISAANMVLSTRDITNQNFLAGEYAFRRVTTKELDMLLLNEGKLEVSNGGFGVLIAGAIENRGVITAKAGTIILAGANAVKLELAGNSLVSIIISEAAARQVLDYKGRPVMDQIKNTGVLDAEGGQVILAAHSINDVFTKAVNLEGVVSGETAVKTGEGTIRIGTKDTVSEPAPESAQAPGADSELPPQAPAAVVRGGQAVNAFLGNIESNGVQAIEAAVPDIEPPAPAMIELESSADVTADAPVTITAREAIDAGQAIEAPTVTEINGGSPDTQSSAVLQAAGTMSMTGRSGRIQTPVKAETLHRLGYQTGGEYGIKASTGIGTSMWTRGPPAQEARANSLEQDLSIPTRGARSAFAADSVYSTLHDAGQNVSKLNGFVYPATGPGYLLIP